MRRRLGRRLRRPEIYDQLYILHRRIMHILANTQTSFSGNVIYASRISSVVNSNEGSHIDPETVKRTQVQRTICYTDPARQSIDHSTRQEPYTPRKDKAYRYTTSFHSRMHQKRDYKPRIYAHGAYDSRFFNQIPSKREIRAKREGNGNYKYFHDNRQ